MDTRADTTRRLLLCGVIAGPLYVAVSLAQAFTREGFDLTRHAWSLLSNGDLGWLQIANFLVTGALTIACALGIRRALQGQRGGTWGPLLIGIYGLGLMAAGFFTADPMDGFPRGTPAGPASSISGHGIMHLVSGAIGFLAMIGACFVFARRFAWLGQPGWAKYSAATGVVFFAAFAGIASGSSQPAIVLSFVSAVILVWLWLALISLLLLRGKAAAAG